MFRKLSQFCVLSLLPVTAYSTKAAAVTFTGTGEDGDFVSTSNVLFDTDIGSVSFDGGTPIIIGDVQADSTVFDFNSILINPGHTINAIGANTLVLLSVEDIIIDGLVDLSGQGGGGSVVFSSPGFVSIGSMAQILAEGGDGEPDGQPTIRANGDDINISHGEVEDYAPVPEPSSILGFLVTAGLGFLGIGKKGKEAFEEYL